MVLQLLLTLESNATSTAKSKGQNSQCTQATKLRGGNLYMILSKRDRLIIVHVTYAWYIRESASMFQIHSYLSINTAYTHLQPHNKLYNLQKSKTQEVILEKPILLPQKDSKSHQKWSRIEGKHLMNGEEAQQRHSQNGKSLIIIIKPE